MPLASTPLPGRTHVLETRQSITTSKELAARMAQVARQIRAAIMQAFVENRPSELLRELHCRYPERPGPIQIPDYSDRSYSFNEKYTFRWSYR